MTTGVATAVTAFSVLLSLRVGSDFALGIAACDLIGLSMILRPSWWNFWMPLGFWEQRASDSHRAGQQGPAIAFLGWVVLLLALLFAGVRSA